MKSQPLNSFDDLMDFGKDVLDQVRVKGASVMGMHPNPSVRNFQRLTPEMMEQLSEKYGSEKVKEYVNEMSRKLNGG